MRSWTYLHPPQRSSVATCWLETSQGSNPYLRFPIHAAEFLRKLIDGRVHIFFLMCMA